MVVIFFGSLQKYSHGKTKVPLEARHLHGSVPGEVLGLGLMEFTMDANVYLSLFN